jgi:hypothetical protein
MGKIVTSIGLIGLGFAAGSAITGYRIITSDIFLNRLKNKIEKAVYERLSGECDWESHERCVAKGRRIIDGYADYHYNHIWFDCKLDAERVIEAMDELLDRYKEVTELDLYDLSGLEVWPRRDFGEFGWTDLRGCRINKGKYGYNIKFPESTRLP